MPSDATSELIANCYSHHHGVRPPRIFEHFLTGASDRGTTAALGYRRASHGPLFLEQYLEQPIEALVSRNWGRVIAREEIVELGNLAASNGMAMIELWGRAANDLGSASQVAVATLTAPLRAMFARIGLPIMELAPALPDALGEAGAQWGSYYEKKPWVCAGNIVAGQQALVGYMARRAGHRQARCAA